LILTVGSNLGETMEKDNTFWIVEVDPDDIEGTYIADTEQEARQHIKDKKLTHWRLIRSVESLMDFQN
jgi:hypothetical protein